MQRVLAAGDDTVVTTETGADDRAVIDPRHRLPAEGSVAILAAGCREYVPCMLAAGGKAVVAGNAVAVYADMVEYCGRPGECHVAIVADVTGLDVAGILAAGGKAVVTVYAGTGYHRVIDSEHGEPRIGAVAGIAVAEKADVPARRSTRLYPAGVGMAVAALSRGARENALHVTGFAGRQGMLEFERENGRVMIEFGTRLLRQAVGCMETAQQRRQQEGEEGPVKALWRVSVSDGGVRTHGFGSCVAPKPRVRRDCRLMVSKCR